MECWALYQRTIQENQRLSFAFLNYLSDEMAWLAGLPSTGPRLEVPLPTYVKNAPVTMNTTNNIHVESGSRVGQINAGAIIYLDRAVSTFNSAGLNQLASTLQSFTQQVVDSNELSAESQREILDLLRAVVEQLPKKKDERNSSVVKLALQSIGPLVNAATAIGPHWERLKLMFESVFR
jgi:hypothetical protein